MNLSKFFASPGAKPNLNRFPTKIEKLYSSQEDYARQLEKNQQQLSELQDKMYAHDRYSLLLIVQGMDTSGKDGLIKHVMSGINPMGCQVASFKQPSAEELDHDYLWRAARRLPERGRIGIFNRSYYEDVLIVKVHTQILHAQQLPEEVLKSESKLWKDRYQDIVNFESHLTHNGTQVLKLFLHISKDEQKERLLKRIDDPQKNWKMNPADIKERAFWGRYMRAYEDCLRNTSTKNAPWYIIPADDKKNARILAGEIVLAEMKKLKTKYPRASKEHLANLKTMRKSLINED